MAISKQRIVQIDLFLSLDELAINFAVNDVKHPFHISKKVLNLKCITFRAHNFFAQIHTVQSNRLTVTDSRRDYCNGSELKNTEDVEALIKSPELRVDFQ